MTLTGENFIGFNKSANGDKSFQAFASTANYYLQGNFTIAPNEEFKKVLYAQDVDKDE